jgi:V/A-type H+-transporting ATPase subunit K
MTVFYITLAILPIAAIIGLFAHAMKQRNRGIPGRKVVISNLVSFAVVLITIGVLTFSVSAATNDTSSAQASTSTSTSQTSESSTGNSKGLGYLAVALATGLSGIGGGIAVAAGAPAAIAATSEDSKAFGKSLIFVALGESIALYGVVISILILNKM